MMKRSRSLSTNTGSERDLEVVIEDLNGWHIGATTLLFSLSYQKRIIARILVDAGLSTEEREDGTYINTTNLDKLESLLGEKPKIGFVILSHAHEDHVGAVPWLVKICHQKGIKPPPKILTHKLTRDQFKIAQKNFHDIFTEPAKNTGEKYTWDLNDVERAYTQLESCSYRHLVPLYQKLEGRFSVDLKFYPNGHIVGSSLVELLVNDQTKPVGRLLYTGDLSLRKGSFLVDGGADVLKDIREPPPSAFVTEGTYLLKRVPKGDRKYIKKELTVAIRPILEREGNVVLAVYSIDRASNVLVCLRELVESGKLPPGVPIFFDTTTGRAIDYHYANAIEEYFGRTFTMELEWEKEIFAKNLVKRWNNNKLMPTQKNDKSYVYKEVVTSEEQRNEIIKDYENGGCIVVATSATFAGGPVMEYLRRWGPNPDNLFLIMGGAIPRTRAARLVSRRERGTFSEKLPIFDPKTRAYFLEEVNIVAELREFSIMSAHATFPELRGLFATFKPDMFLITHLGARRIKREKKVKEGLKKILSGEWGIHNWALLSERHKYTVPLKELIHYPLILDKTLWNKLRRIGKNFGYKMTSNEDFKKTIKRSLAYFEELYKKGIRIEED